MLPTCGLLLTRRCHTHSFNASKHLCHANYIEQYHIDKLNKLPQQDVYGIYYQCCVKVMNHPPVNNEWFLHGIPYLDSSTKLQLSKWFNEKGYHLIFLHSGIHIKIKIK